MLKKIIFYLFLSFVLSSCGTPSQPIPLNSQTSSTVDTAFASAMNATQGTVTHISAPIPEKISNESLPADQSSNTLNLEIKENIVLDKSLTFYYYMPTSNNGYKSDKVFYFLLNETTLTLQQYDKNMSLTLQGDFTVSKPWTRTLTIEYNILKTSLTSANNKEVNFEIGLKNSKVSYVKIGDNKFYAKQPSSPPKIVSRSTSSYHTIRPGENIKLLAEANCTTVRAILDLNPKINSREDYVVYPGEDVRIK
jgi:LysM repeat protein